MQENKLKYQRFSYLFEKYLKGICSKQEAKEIVDILENPSYDQLIKSEAYKFWNEFSDVNEKRDSMSKILDKLHHRISLNDEEKLKSQFINKRFIQAIIRAAAVLFIPLMIYSGYLTFKVRDARISKTDQVILQTIKVPAGIQTDFILPDGSHVWLNSCSIFKYPGSFQGELRQVELIGEAYFDITKDPDRPFIVKAGNLNVEVKGTTFDVINYPDDSQIEVILESGQVNLFTGNYKDYDLIALMEPGEKATYNTSRNITSIQNVDVDKYTVWKNGILIFRDDPMNEVTRKLSRRFNVDIELQSLDLKEYVYTATFINESLAQILELLKISAPIKYTIIKPKQLDDNSYSKTKIIITKIK